MKSAIEIVIEHAEADCVTPEEYLLRKTYLAVLKDRDGTFSSGREYLVVEVNRAKRVSVVDAYESSPRADLSIYGPGGELRRGRNETSEYFVIKGSPRTSEVSSESTQQVLGESTPALPSPDGLAIDLASPRRPFSRRGMIWISNRRSR